MISTSDRILLAIGLVGALLAAAVVTVAVPRIYDTLISHGFDLPPWTHFLASYYLAAWILPALVLGLWAAFPERKWRAAVASAPGLLALLVLLVAAAGYVGLFRVSVTI